MPFSGLIGDFEDTRYRDLAGKYLDDHRIR